MTYRAVPGKDLGTRWDDEPSMVVTNRRDQGGVIELSWATEPIRPGWVPGRTRATFDDVLEYRWRYFDVDEDSAEEGGLELGEITDSRRVAELSRQGFHFGLRHYVISFDEHGTYDVICTGLRVEYRAGSPAGSPEPAWTASPGSEANGDGAT